MKAQPIAVEDVIAYLLQAVELPVGEAAVFEIDGADQVSYGEIMKEYARQCGLRRWTISVPFLTPHLQLVVGPSHSYLRPRRSQTHRKPAQYDPGAEPIGSESV